MKFGTQRYKLYEELEDCALKLLVSTPELSEISTIM